MREKGKKENEQYLNRTGQSKVYIGKFARIFVREKQWLMIIMSALIAFLVSKVVGSNLFVTMEGTLLGSLAVSCVCLWNGVFNSIQVICRERAIVKREHRSGLSITAYLFSHMVSQMVLCLVQTMVMMFVMWLSGVKYPAEGLVTGNFIIDLFISLFLVTYAADMLGLAISCIVRSTTIAMTVMPFLLIIQLIFAGVAFPLSGGMENLSNITVTKWGVTAICTEADYNNLPSVSILNQMNKISAAYPEFGDLMVAVGIDRIKMASATLAQKPEYRHEATTVMGVWSVLALFIVGFGVVGFVFLKRIDHDKR